MTTAQDRRESIAKMLEERESLTVSELIARFKVTDTSIRHDLTVLEQAGKLQRVRGGAITPTSARSVSSFAALARQNAQEKRRIGRVAADLVRPGDVVLLDSGSTVAEVAVQMPGALRGPHAITIVSHSLPVIDEVTAAFSIVPPPRRKMPLPSLASTWPKLSSVSALLDSR